MSECAGEGCTHSSHKSDHQFPEASSEPMKIVGDGSHQDDGRLKPPEKTVDAPPFCVFRRGDVFPMRGFNYEFIGYTKDFHLVFKGNGPTAKALKKSRTPKWEP